MPIYLTAITSAVSLRQWPRQTLPTAVRGQSAATYRTSQGTYFVFHTESNAVTAYKITPTNPPTIVPAWTVSQTGLGSPWVTSTDGTNNVIVWVAGAGGDQRLHGYNGDTGEVVYAGGGANELMTGTANGTPAWWLAVAFTTQRITRSMLLTRPRERLRLPRLQRRHHGDAYSYRNT